MTKTVTVLLGRGTRVLALAIFFVVAMSPGFAQAQAGGGLGADVTITPDVVYGHKDGMALTFDVFKPTSPNGAATLHIVSGGWVSRYTPPTALRPADQDLYKQLLDRGFTVFAVRHGGSPRYNIPEIVPDVRRAVSFIRMTASRYGINPDRMGVFGMSAGGHLSLMLATASSAGDSASEDEVLRVSNRVAAAVAFYPPVDLAPSANAVATERPSKRFPAMNFDAALIADVSPIRHVSADDPPTLLLHGDADKLVPMVQSELIYKAFMQNKVTTDRIVIPGAGHGFKDADFKRATAATVDWFTKHLTSSGGGAAR
jgi:acetyl esterase/lipase